MSPYRSLKIRRVSPNASGTIGQPKSVVGYPGNVRGSNGRPAGSSTPSVAAVSACPVATPTETGA